MPEPTTNTPDLDVQLQAFKDMELRWTLPDALLGGTLEMRKQGETYLPKQKFEKQEDYARRRDRSILYEGYRDAKDELVGKPFSKPVTIAPTEDALPEVLRPMLEDMDGEGTSLQDFAAAWLDGAIHRGLEHVLVDLPKNPERRVPADPNAPRLKPNARLIPASTLPYWRSKMRGSQRVLTEIRIRSSDVDFDEQGREKAITTLERWSDGEWRTYERDSTAATGGWVPKDGGVHTFGEIPLVTLYTRQTGYMTAAPALEGLAWLNLAHWQSDSDQRNILNAARCPLFSVSGASSEQQDKGQAIGPHESLWLPAGAEAKWVEIQGGAIQAGAEDIKTLEARMEVMGLQPLMTRTNVTATREVRDESNTENDIQTWIGRLQIALRRVFEMAARWVGVELPKDFRVRIFSNFRITQAGMDEINALLAARTAGQISQKRYLLECQLRSFYDESMDAEQEIEDSKNDQPLALVGVGDEDEEDDKMSEDMPPSGKRERMDGMEGMGGKAA